MPRLPITTERLALFGTLLATFGDCIPPATTGPRDRRPRPGSGCTARTWSTPTAPPPRQASTARP